MTPILTMYNAPMQTTWEYSHKTEGLRIIQTACKIGNGFYRQIGFPIEFYSQTANSRTVWLPKLPFHQYPRFWAKVAKLNIDDLPFEYDPRMLEFIIQHLTKQSEPDMGELKKLWQKYETEILDHIYAIVPTKITGITIHPTRYGTGGSWNVRKNESEPLIIYLREDWDIWGLVEAIITSITRYGATIKLDGNWHETEFLADWLVQHSTLGKFLNSICKSQISIPTIKYLRLKNLAELMTISEKVYQELGLPTANLTIPTLKNLTSQEQKIWNLFVQNAGKTVSFDDLANIMFVSDDDFSLEAIVKAIQRLRTKLETNGITGSLVQTVRSEGYCLPSLDKTTVQS